MGLPFNSARLANALRRYAGVRGPISLALLEDVMPMIIVGDPERPEMALDFNIKFFSAYSTVVAIAGNYSAVVYANTASAGSPFLVVIDEVTIIDATGGSFIRCDPTTPVGALTPSNTTIGMDDERVTPSTNLPVAGQTYSVAAVPGPGTQIVAKEGVTVAGFPFFTKAQRVVLPPGGGLIYQCSSAVNHAFEASIRGYVIEVTPEELITMT